MCADPTRATPGCSGPFGQVRPNGDGFTLSGRWPFCSNSLHSAWIGLGTFWYGDGDEPEPIPRLRARADGRRHHRAHLGRAGSLRDRQPPRVGRRRGRRPVSARSPSSTSRGPTGRSGGCRCSASSGPALGITPLGMARGALDEVAKRIEGNVGGMRGWPGRRSGRPGRLRRGRRGAAGGAGRVDGRRAAGHGTTPSAARRSPSRCRPQVMMSMNYGCQVAFDVTATGSSPRRRQRRLRRQLAAAPPPRRADRPAAHHVRPRRLARCSPRPSPARTPSPRRSSSRSRERRATLGSSGGRCVLARAVVGRGRVGGGRRLD